MKNIINTYRDFYGCTAAIFKIQDGSYRLRMKLPSGKQIHNKSYKTERGALIAMGRASDGWNKV